VQRKVKKKTRRDNMNKLVKQVMGLLPTYTKEQLKDLWVKCFTERVMLICSTDFEATDCKNQQRKDMLCNLKILQSAIEKQLESKG